MEKPLRTPIIPKNKEQLENLYSSKVPGECKKTGPFQHVAALAMKTLKVPLALVIFTDKNYVVKPNAGLELKDKLGKGKSLNSLAILKDDLNLLTSASEDEIFLLANPLIASGFGFRFLADAQVNTQEGNCIGTVCILDKEPRELFESDQRFLDSLASAVMNEMEERQLLKTADE